MTIEYVIGDVTEPIEDHAVNLILHCCNDLGIAESGVVVSIANAFPGWKKDYQEWAYGKFINDYPFAGGSIQMYNAGTGTVVVNIIGQRGICYDTAGNPPVRYDWIETGFNHVLNHLKIADKRYSDLLLPILPYVINMPRIGCGLAGGNWEIIEELIKEIFIKNGYRVIVYDLKVPVESEKR